MRNPPVNALELSPALQPGGISFNLLTLPPPITTSVGSSAAINRATGATAFAEKRPPTFVGC
jgi:hypothetical protein